MPQPQKAVIMHEGPHNRPVEELSTAIASHDLDLTLVQSNSYTESRRHLSDAEIVITRSIDDELLAEATELEWIQALNAGVDHYNLSKIRERDIILTNASGVHATPAAEQVVGNMLLFERNLLQGIRQQRQREWRHFGGGELNGSTIGIVGVGEIGGAVADLATALNMETLGMRQDPRQDHPSVDEMFGPDRLHELLCRSNYLVLACPLTEETRGLLSVTEFESMQSDAVLINVARGEVVDEEALTFALQKGKIGGAALDVQTAEPLPDDSPLWGLSNVVITPHMAGSSPKYLDRCADIFVSNYERYRRGDYEELENRVF